jgi:hypothetical protein
VFPEQVSFGGIYLPIFLVFLAGTGLIYLALRFVLVRFQAYRFFWHPALAGAALFIIVLSVMILMLGP